MDTAILCIFCRNVGHRTKDCPSKRENTSLDKALHSEPSNEAKVLNDFRQQKDNVCARCLQYPLLDILQRTHFQDMSELEAAVKTPNQLSMEEWRQRWKDETENRLHLGTLDELILFARCPLCRLIFGIFPRQDLNFLGHGSDYYVEPIASYDFLSTTADNVSAILKKQYVIHFAVKQTGESANSILVHGGTHHGHVAMTFAPTQNHALHRNALCARKVPANVDYTLLSNWLQRCQSMHSGSCEPEWSDTLRTSRMIEVHIRKVVPCPDNCRYIALSYVWGGVHPEKGALENRKLPQTIEDAMEVTVGLGMSYLWVDALCIDQEPTPAKTQQLAMMDLIYKCACVTIVALSGANSNSGLPSVGSNLRSSQVVETINNVQFAMTGPQFAGRLERSEYNTRAWTLQEMAFSSRRIVFESQQTFFVCSKALFSESIDTIHDPANILEAAATNELELSNMQVMSRGHSMRLDDEYRTFVAMYTARKMSYDNDSLNAGTGMLNHLQKTHGLSPFVWGLPLDIYPQSLRWYHARVLTPRRREDFPSWSWTGWEGEALYSDSLDLTRSSRVTCTDLTARFLAIDDQTLTLEGHLVRLDIRNEFFSEAFAPGSDKLIGILQERNDVGTTLIPATYDFLVIERSRFRSRPGDSWLDRVYMLLLEWDGEVAVRRTMVMLAMEEHVDEVDAGAVRQIVKLK